MSSATDLGGLAAQLALARRVASRLGLADWDGHFSARADDGRVLVTPAAAATRSRRVTPLDILTLGLDGRLLDGDAASVPAGVALDLAIYRLRSEVRAVATGSPTTASAFGSTRREILPLTHTWAEYVLDGAGWIDPAAWATGAVEDLERQIAGAMRQTLLHVAGVAVITLGDEPLDTLRRLDAVEYLARMTVVATELDPRPRVVTADEAASIPGQRPAEAAPSRDYRRFYRSFDVRAPATVDERWPAEDAIARTRRDVAVACRVLAASGDLVAFFEHVSHRIPGRDDIFAMSPAMDFARMDPDDVAVLETAGDCRPLEGPFPPAPFRWYHRDILQQRRDVAAIVHTHELHGRAWMLAGATTPPIHRWAIHQADGLMPPAYGVPSLVFAPEDRARMLERLGNGAWVHNVAHGTDTCAADLPTAVVAAVAWESHLRFAQLARRLGPARPLAQPEAAALAAALTPADIVWEELCDAVPW